MDLPKRAPLAAIFPGEATDSPAALPSAKIQVEQWDSTNHRIAVDSSGPARIALRLLNYPAWQVTVNGKRVAPEKPEDLDQMLVPISEGNSEIQVLYVRTPDQTAGIALSIVSLLISAGLLASRKSSNA
jgi:hypothetical protein